MVNYLIVTHQNESHLADTNKVSQDFQIGQCYTFVCILNQTGNFELNEIAYANQASNITLWRTMLNNHPKLYNFFL